jgi:uncharacterized RDD family membrane protein YckC
MWSMKITKAVKKVRVFDPHQTACAEALAGVPLASFWQRATAFVIDFTIVLAVYIPFEMVRQYLVLASAHRPLHIAVNFRLHNLQDLIFLVVYAGLSVWWTDGLTVGKRLLRIRIVSLVHTKITLWQSMERALGYGASALEGGFGFIQFFIHRNRQCVHDRIAETIVVRGVSKDVAKNGVRAHPKDRSSTGA